MKKKNTVLLISLFVVVFITVVGPFFAKTASPQYGAGEYKEKKFKCPGKFFGPLKALSACGSISLKAEKAFMRKSPYGGEEKMEKTDVLDVLYLDENGNIYLFNPETSVQIERVKEKKDILSIGFRYNPGNYFTYYNCDISLRTLEGMRKKGCTDDIAFVCKETECDEVKREQYGKVLKVGGIEFVWVPAGCFKMGSKLSKDEMPVHKVCVDGFYMTKYEITQKQWHDVMQTAPWKGKQNAAEGESYPATHVDWGSAYLFVQYFNKKYYLNVDLPTEAEWEYAARAGSEAKWPFGDDAAMLGEYAWYHDNTVKAGMKSAQKVGLKRPNPWGLYDMQGNVWEWCSDSYNATFYSKSPEKNPRFNHATSHEGTFIMRGGAWNSGVDLTRVAFRGDKKHDYSSANLGFRMVYRVKKE